MGKSHKPRSGSMQFWPRKRANRPYTRVRSWPILKENKPVGFAGYKVGMTHLHFIDNSKASITKNQEIMIPCTVIECPPLKSASIILYKKDVYGLHAKKSINAEKLDKELAKKIRIPKKAKSEEINPNDYQDIRLLVYTQPKLTTIGKKKPELFEIGLGGSVEEKFNFAKEKLGKEITISDVFQAGNQVDVSAVTKGKGFQGPVKRFGIAIRSHKSEKVIRGPGSLGGWKGQGHFMYRIAHAGQTGYHQRKEYNKWILKVGEDPKEINPLGGFKNYGLVKSNYILIKGSIAGPRKRLIKLISPARPNNKIPKEAPQIKYISLSSHQG